MTNKELLEEEIKRLKVQLNTLNNLIVRCISTSEPMRLKGKREGIRLAIENLEETLKDLNS